LIAGVLQERKELSDMWLDDEQYQLGNDVERPMQLERFNLPSGSDFYSLYQKRHLPNLGKEINMVLEAIEDANSFE
jgi:type I restriction enzyme M protein